MKTLGIISAGLMVAVTLVPAAAGAQMHRDRVVVRTVHSERHSGYDRDRTRRVCKVQYRHHHRVRVCRTVRF